MVPVAKVATWPSTGAVTSTDRISVAVDCAATPKMAVSLTTVNGRAALQRGDLGVGGCETRSEFLQRRVGVVADDVDEDVHGAAEVVHPDLAVRRQFHVDLVRRRRRPCGHVQVRQCRHLGQVRRIHPDVRLGGRVDRGDVQRHSDCVSRDRKRAGAVTVRTVHRHLEHVTGTQRCRPQPDIVRCWAGVDDDGIRRSGRTSSPCHPVRHLRTRLGSPAACSPRPTRSRSRTRLRFEYELFRPSRTPPSRSSIRPGAERSKQVSTPHTSPATEPPGAHPATGSPVQSPPRIAVRRRRRTTHRRVSSLGHRGAPLDVHVLEAAG